MGLKSQKADLGTKQRSNICPEAHAKKSFWHFWPPYYLRSDIKQGHNPVCTPLLNRNTSLLWHCHHSAAHNNTLHTVCSHLHFPALFPSFTTSPQIHLNSHCCPFTTIYMQGLFPPVSQAHHSLHCKHLKTHTAFSHFLCQHVYLSLQSLNSGVLCILQALISCQSCLLLLLQTSSHTFELSLLCSTAPRLVWALFPQHPQLILNCSLFFFQPWLIPSYYHLEDGWNVSEIAYFSRVFILEAYRELGMFEEIKAKDASQSSGFSVWKHLSGNVCRTSSFPLFKTEHSEDPQLFRSGFYNSRNISFVALSKLLNEVFTPKK